MCQWDHHSLRVDSRWPPCFGESHDGGHRRRLRFVRQQLGEHTCDVEHLGRVVEVRPGAGCILVRASIRDFDRRQHGIEPLGPRLRSRHFERHAGLRDLALGSDQALRERRLRKQECSGDLAGRESAHEPQRQRRARIRRNRRMATHEDQAQALVGNRRPLGRHGLLDFPLQLGCEPVLRPASSQRIDCAAIRRLIQPRRRIARRTFARPRFERTRAGIGERILCEIEIAKPRCERRDDASARFAEYQSERRARHPATSSGRISTAPVCESGTFFAIAIAASRSVASIR